MLVWLTALLASSRLGELEFRSVGPGDAHELHALLAQNYITSTDGALQTVYPARTIRWILRSPGSERELHLGMSERGSRELVGFVCATPAPLRLRGEAHPRDAVEVTLLSVRRGCRGHGIARRLLAELRARGARCGVQCAIYTGAERRGEPLLTTACYHRPLRVRHLLRRGFWELPRGATCADVEAATPPLPRAPRALRLRRLRPRDAAACRELLCVCATEADLGAWPSLEQFRHRYLDVPAVCSLLLPASRPGAPARAFVSFALQPVRTPHARPVIQAVLLGLAVAPGESVHWVLAEALAAARARGAHVFNALPLGELTPRVLAALGFGEGDGSVHLYVEGGGGGAGKTLDPRRVGWIPLL